MATEKKPDMARDITTRTMTIRAGSIDEKARTVEAVITTEQPAEVWDWKRYEIIRETLRMDGAIFPEQVPLLEVHQRGSLETILGSIRTIRIDGDALVGVLHFAEGNERADLAWDLVRQGHLTDVSGGYKPMDAIDIKANSTATVNGREYTTQDLPLRVTTKWKLKEGSLVPIGADDAAKIRQEAGIPQHNEETQTMEEVTKKEAPSAPPVDLDKVRSEAGELAIKAERERLTAIRKLAGDDIPKPLVEKAEADGWTVERAQGEFLTALRATKTPAIEAVSVEVGPSLTEGLVRALSDQIQHRYAGAEIGDQKALRAAREYDGIGFRELAAIALRAENKRVPFNSHELAGEAVRSAIFADILSDSANKSLARGYQLAAPTCRMWTGVRNVSTFLDYKDIRLGEFTALQRVAKGGGVKSGALSESSESYSADTYGIKLALSRQDIINDTLGAWALIPVKQGNAVARNEDDVVYALLVSASGTGPTMNEDSVVMFSASHVVKQNEGKPLTVSNYYVNASAALDVTSLGVLKQYMRLQRAEGGAYLNITPRYLLVPAALEQTAYELVKSPSFVAVTPTTGSAVARVPSINIHAGTLETVVEPRLDSATNGTTAFYITADPMQAESIVRVYLNGNQGPVMERRESADVLGMEWIIYHDFGAAAVDYRGAMRSKGTS